MSTLGILATGSGYGRALGEAPHTELLFDVPQAISDLQSSLNGLGELVHDLSLRLVPILRDNSAVDENPIIPESPAMCQLSGSIKSQIKQVQIIQDNLRNVIHRLEI